jgi:hypothetical protein
MLRGLPNLRLPEAPDIRNAPTLRQRPDDAATPPPQFHLPTTASAPTADSHSIHLNRWRLRHRRKAMFSAAIASVASCMSTTEPQPE